MNETSLRVTSPAGLAVIITAAAGVSACILFTDPDVIQAFFGLPSVCALYLFCFWHQIRSSEMTWKRVDQWAWAILIGHTVYFLPGRDPRALTQDQGFTAFIALQVAIWCLCLSYAVLRLLTCMGRLSNLRGPAGKYVTLFLLAAVASSLYAVSPVITMAWSLKLLSIVVVACLLFDPRDPAGSCERFLEATWLGLLVLLGFFLIVASLNPESAFEVSRVGQVWRLGGSLFPPTKLSAVGGILAMLSLVDIMQGVATRSTKAIFAFSLGTMVASVGRGGILAAGVAMVIVVALYQRIRLAMSLAALTGVVFALVPGTASGSWEVLSRRQGLDEIATLTGRVPLWETALDLIKERPLLGWGYVSGSRVTLIATFRKWQAVDAHNAFLQALLTLGVVGLSIVLVLLWKVMLRAWRAIHAGGGSPATHRRATALLGLAVFLTVQGLLEGALCSVPNFETAIFVGAGFWADYLRRTQ
ncbi:MAG TPA: O-antigen ligase family protein [Candidatus Polarisedimenticolia bacterium]|jgi:O-antigen ligase